MAREHRQVPLRREALRAPEAHEPERHRCRHDGQRRRVHRHPSARLSAAAVATEDASPGGARERSRRELADDLLRVLPRCPCGPPRSASGRPYAGSQLVSSMPEVDGGGDDDCAAGDGRYCARYGCAALLLADGEAERDGAPYDEEAPRKVTHPETRLMMFASIRHLSFPCIPSSRRAGGATPRDAPGTLRATSVVLDVELAIPQRVRPAMRTIASSRGSLATSEGCTRSRSRVLQFRVDEADWPRLSFHVTVDTVSLSHRLGDLPSPSRSTSRRGTAGCRSSRRSSPRCPCRRL